MLVDVGTGLAMLSISAPVTVAVLKYVGRGSQQNGFVRKDMFEAIQKRQDAWMKSIDDGLKELNHRVRKQGELIAALRRKPSDTSP